MYRIGIFYLFNENKDYSYRYAKMAILWKKLMKNVNLDEPSSFLDNVNLGCTPRECEPNEIVIEGSEKCSNHEEQLRSYQGGEDLT